jgi:hypothetical protein
MADKLAEDGLPSVPPAVSGDVDDDLAETTTTVDKLNMR